LQTFANTSGITSANSFASTSANSSAKAPENKPIKRQITITSTVLRRQSYLFKKMLQQKGNVCIKDKYLRYYSFSFAIHGGEGGQPLVYSQQMQISLIKTSCSKFSAIKIRPGLLRPQNVRPVLESLPSAAKEDRAVLYLTNRSDQASLKKLVNKEKCIAGNRTWLEAVKMKLQSLVHFVV
jgi:hypothetical protein